jgi:hypothetical protein
VVVKVINAAGLELFLLPDTIGHVKVTEHACHRRLRAVTRALLFPGRMGGAADILVISGDTPSFS